MFGDMGKNLWGSQVCFFMDWKVASKKLDKNAPEPSISHYRIFSGHQALKCQASLALEPMLTILTYFDFSQMNHKHNTLLHHVKSYKFIY